VEINLKVQQLLLKITWLLHKDGHETEDTMGEEKPTKKVYTTKDFGKVTFADFDIYKD
jgi:hypothetical protein